MGAEILAVKRLRKSFGAVRSCQDLSFTVQRGVIHALIGPNGAGKTTVANLLSGELRPDGGHIIFAGADITTLKTYQRARIGLARSFQITQVFEELSVAENMALAILANEGGNFRFWHDALCSPVVLERLPLALERVDLVAQQKMAAKHLSHGERRQLEVGMALAGRPTLLILDEPMAGQGPGGTRELSRIIKDLKNEVSILLVEHDMQVVFSLADHITVLVNGACIADGPPEAIRQDAAVQAAYLGRQ